MPLSSTSRAHGTEIGTTVPTTIQVIDQTSTVPSTPNGWAGSGAAREAIS
jgi:hypothetical protein